MSHPTEEDALADRKGVAVELKDGTLRAHRGYTGAWIDLAKAPTPEQFLIIVQKL